MLTGLLHSHKYLGYLVGVIVILNFLLTLVGARKNPGLAKLVGGLTKIGLQAVGGIVILAGFYLTHRLSHWGSWWIWVSLVLWVPVAITGKRGLMPEVELVKSGGQASGRMIMAAAIQLLLVVAIIGLMTVKPGSG